MTIENKSSIEGEVIIDLRYEDSENPLAGLELSYIQGLNDNIDALVSLTKHPDEGFFLLYHFMIIFNRRRGRSDQEIK